MSKLEQSLIPPVSQEGEIRLRGGNAILIGGKGVEKRSKSPQMWEAAGKLVRIPLTYTPIEISDVEGVKQTIDEHIASDPLWRGGNVTNPWKVLVYLLLRDHEVAGKHTGLGKSARLAGSVNTIVWRNGELIGHNTDGMGEVGSLSREVNLDKSNFLLLGAGGALRGLLPAFFYEAHVPKIAIYNRTRARAEEISESMSVPIDIIPEGKLAEQIVSGKFNVILNTTTIGQTHDPDDDGDNYADYSPLASTDLSVEDNNAISLEILREAQRKKPGIFIADILYSNPPSPLIQQAMSLGLRTQDGRGMVVRQAALAFQRVFNTRTQFERLVNTMDAAFDLPRA